MQRRAMILLLFTFVAIISCKVQASLQINAPEHTLMQYTKRISEEHFADEIPLVIVLPLVEDDSTNEEVLYLIEELHASNRWPVLVINTTYGINGNVGIEVNRHGGYIILTSLGCEKLEEILSGFQEQLFVLSEGTLWQSWNPSAEFLVVIMGNCTYSEKTNISRSILSECFTFKVTSATVLYLKSSEHDDKHIPGNTSDSAQFELHTWYPYEDSQSCSPAESAIHVHVLTERNLSEIQKSKMHNNYIYNNFQGCEIKVHIREIVPYVYPPKIIWYNDSTYRKIYEEGWDIELLKIIGKSLNMSPNTEDNKKMAYRKRTTSLYIGPYTATSFISKYTETTRSYFNIYLAWYTPCAIKHQRWSYFFKILSAQLWISFALSLVLAVITVCCISNCRIKAHLQEFQSYRNISSITTNFIAVLLSVSVNTQPRTVQLRVFFFCWVSYCVAVSTVFQAYLTTFLMEPGYEEPIKSVKQMLKSGMKFGFIEKFENIFKDTTDFVESAILKDAVTCPNWETCFEWATKYQNISIILPNHYVGDYRRMGLLTDENNRPLLCELEDGGVKNTGVVFFVSKGNYLLERINNIIDHIVQGGIFTQIREIWFHKQKLQSELDSYVLDNGYCAINISHLQTVFYLLILGYIVALACFVIEIMWHRFR